MGLFCSIWGCSDEPRDFWGDNAEYVLFRCKRCHKETILCSKENRIFDNNDEGKKLRDLMMVDPEFSKQCVIHHEFLKAEKDNMFSISKMEKATQEVREKYGLAPGFRPADPVVLWQNGLWKPKPSKKKGENNEKKTTKNNGENPAQSEDANNFTPNMKIEILITKLDELSQIESVEWNDISPSEEFFKGEKPELSVKDQLSKLERRLKKHVDREEYEKAAKIRDEIALLNAQNK